MRIALFIDDLNSQEHNVKHINRLIDQLNEHNDIVVFTRFCKDKSIYKNVKIVLINKFINIFNKEFKNEIRTPFEIIHINSEQGINRIGIRLSKRKNVPTTYTFHGINYKNKPWRENLKNILWTATQVDKFIVPLETLSTVLQQQGFNKDVDIIDNAIETTGWERPEPKVWQEFRDSLGVGNTFNIMYIGKISDNQHSEMLFQSFLKTHHSIPSATLIIIGEGLNTDKYIDFIEVNELKDSVIWYDHVSEDLMPKYLTLGDISIVTTDREKHRDWILFSMLNKMPVIARDSVFVKRIINLGKDTNLLVYKTPEELHDRIAQVYSSGAEFYKKLQINGLETAKGFSPKHMSMKYLHLWDKLKS